MQRFNIAPIVKRHFQSVNRPGTRARLDFGAIAVVIGVPLLLGIAAFVFGIRASSINLLTPLLMICGFLVGGMLTLFVFLVNLRVKISETPEFDHRRHLKKLIADVSASCLYLALVAFTLGTVSVLSAAYSSTWWGPIHSALIGFAIFTYTHIALTLLTVIRRLFAVYEDFFRRDHIVPLAHHPRQTLPSESGSESRRVE